MRHMTRSWDGGWVGWIYLNQLSHTEVSQRAATCGGQGGLCRFILKGVCACFNGMVAIYAIFFKKKMAMTMETMCMCVCARVSRVYMRRRR